jgi:ABC-type Mn2+/Zn2+ transport system ATPase subunit
MPLLLNIVNFNPLHERSKELLYCTPVTATLTSQTICRLDGPNGVGKSTLFRALLGLNPHFSGSVHWSLSHNPLSGLLALREQGVIYMPQKGYSLRSLSVGELRGLLTSHPLRNPVRSRLLTFLDKFKNCSKRKIGELSGGEQQMCALLATLAQPGCLYLLDEPFRSIDPGHRTGLWDIFRDIFTKGQAGLILTDHDGALDGVLKFDAHIRLEGKEA